MKVGIVIQARMGSTRFPGKVLAELAGEPVIDRVVARCRRATTVDEVIVATTLDPVDDVLAAHCREAGIEVFRGSTDDVLGRYFAAAHAHGLDVIVRVTADCPLIDPTVIDDVVEALRTTGSDYATNSMPMRLPHGLEVSAMTGDALERIASEATSPVDREHVTRYARERPDSFSTEVVTYPTDAYDLRVTIDHLVDLEVVRFVFAELARRQEFGHAPEVIRILREHPSEAARNSMHRPGEGLQKSIDALDGGAPKEVR
jgi:spore coat polysaccharide biosynthesis protein SpsF (cytidylyltransferase family)